MARKPTTRVEFTLFDVVYEDGSQRSNRRVHRRTGPAHRGEVRHSSHCREEHTSIRQQESRRGHAIVAIRVSIGLMVVHYFIVDCDISSSTAIQYQRPLTMTHSHRHRERVRIS